MTDNSCTCRGIEFAQKIVQYTDNPALPEPVQVAQEIFNHLEEQSNRPANSHLKEQVKKDFEDIRFELMRTATGQGVMPPVDRIRDKIHKSDALKELLICGDTMGKQERKNTVAILAKVWEILAHNGEANTEYEYNEALDALEPLNDLAAHFECGRTEKKYIPPYGSVAYWHMMSKHE